MGDKTGIQWTDASWNPTTGCDRISPGCDRCYALTMAKRLRLMGNPRYQVDGDPRTSGPGFGVTLHRDLLELPLRWKRPRRIFVNSMSDLFHPQVPPTFIEDVFATMLRANWHTFQILTKRPQRMQRLVNQPLIWTHDLKPIPNIWLGVSIEDDRYSFRADHLRDTPAAVRFLSLEPLIGPLPSLDLDEIDWIIVGCESGPGARPMDLDWVRDLRDRCANHPCEYGEPHGWTNRTDYGTGYEDDAHECCRGTGTRPIPFFVKQLPSATPGRPLHQIEDFPEDLRVRQYPA